MPISNLSDLLMQRVDPKTTQQAPPPRATAADSTFLLNQVQQRNPQLKQFYSNPNNQHRLYHNYANNAQGWHLGLSELQKENYFPPVQKVAEGTKKRVATEKARIAAGETPKTGRGKDITNPQEIANIQNDESGFIAPNVYQGRNFNPGYEGENIDFNAPYAVFDPRIEPQNLRLSDSPAGLFTNSIPVYDPLAITPWAQLSKADQKLRLEKYGTVSTPYEKKIDLLPSDGSGSMRMSVPVQGSPTGRIAVKGSGISGSSQGGNNKKATGSIRVTGGGGNVPAEAVFLTKGKKSAKGQGQGQVVIQGGQGQGQVVAPQKGQSTTSMLGMAPESTYIQNAPTNKRSQASIDAENFDRTMQNAGTELADGQMPEGLNLAQDPTSQYAYTQPYRIVNAYRRDGSMQGYRYPDKHPLSGKQLPFTFMVSPDGTILESGYQGKAGDVGNTIWGYGDRMADDVEKFKGKNISEIGNLDNLYMFSEGQGFNRDYNPVRGEESLGNGFYRKIATNATKELSDPKGRRTKEQVAKEIQDLASKKEANNWWNSISQKGPYSK